MCEALAAASTIVNETDRSEILVMVTPHLELEQLNEALATAKAIRSEEVRSKALAALAPHLAPEQLREALAAAKAISDERYSAEAMVALLSCFSGALKREALLELIDLAGHASRRVALSAVQNGARWTFELGGQAAVLELCRGIRDVCRWYP